MQPIATAADIERGVAELAARDPRLIPVIGECAEIPLRLTGPGFASLASIIVSQQVSRQSADAIWERFMRIVDPLEPEAFLAGGEEAWREIGLSRPKQRAICAVCEAVLSSAVDLHGLCAMDAGKAFDAMVSIKGIGPWTAEIYLLFAAGHPDIFPAGDVALKAAVAEALELPVRPSEKELRAIAESWSPWRGVAARIFWAFYARRRNRTVIPV
jgi:DNA-3-methyladenine glycosylase II